MGDPTSDDGGRPRPARRAWRAIAWYLVIAAFNAVFYVALAAGLVALGVSPPVAGSLALLPVLAISYVGHKSKTFRSAGLHRHEAPRFIAMSVIDLMLAAAVPQLAVYWRAPPIAAFVVLTGFIPFANFLLIRFWIFRVPETR